MNRAEVIAALRELADGDGINYRQAIFAALRIIGTSEEK